MRRTYGQYCTLARALDVVGERWTLLIVRELLVRPRRFGELLEGLPGISRNLLAARLRQLEAEGLIERRKAEQPSGHAYELTEEGKRLAPALAELARWGAGRLGALGPGDAFQGQWMMGTMRATADREAARGVHETYEIDVEGDVFHVEVDDGKVTPRLGHASEPDLTLRTYASVVSSIGAGERSVVDAVADGGVAVEGSSRSVEHFVAIFGSFWGVEGAASG